MKYKIEVSGVIEVEVEASGAEKAEEIITDLLSGDLAEGSMLKLDQEKVLALGELSNWEIDSVVEVPIYRCCRPVCWDAC